MVFCVKCGYQLDGIKVCPRCGTPAVDIRNEYLYQANPAVQVTTEKRPGDAADQSQQYGSMGENIVKNQDNMSPIQIQQPTLYEQKSQTDPGEINTAGFVNYRPNQSGFYPSDSNPQITNHNGQVYPPNQKGTDYGFQQNGNYSAGANSRGYYAGQNVRMPKQTQTPYSSPGTTAMLSMELIDKYGQYIGIGLLVVAFLAVSSAPSFISFVIAVASIVGAAICLKRKYKLFGFNIAAIVIAAICIVINVADVGGDIMWELSDAKDELDDYVSESSSEERSTTSSYDTDDGWGSGYDDEDSEQTNDEYDTYGNDSYDSDEEKNEVSNSGMVDPDLKAFLDEYEIFMDKYIEFMKSYNNSTDVASMMTQYTEIVGEYYKYMEALDKYDTDTMSAADAAYYLEVVARVEKKLLQATGY